jgi:aryl-alcohol dehydrogenase-like predicted oxidoreductase
MYSDGESEVIVGKALEGRRDAVVLATKGHFQMGEGPNRSGNSRRWLKTAVEESLRRLRTDWIDLYQIHRPDPDTDIEETLGALSDLVHQGKIRAFGCSTFPAEQIVEAQHVSERAGLLRFRTEQPPYSMLARGIEAAVLPVCQRYGMGVMVWSPLASGFLSGRVRRGRPAEQTMNRPSIQPDRFELARPENQAKLDATERLAQVAANAGCSLAAMAIAFTLAHPAVTSAIIGPRTIEQLESLLDGADLVLDDATLDRVDEIVPRAPTSPPTGSGAPRRSATPRCDGARRARAPRRIRSRGRSRTQARWSRAGGRHRRRHSG